MKKLFYVFFILVLASCSKDITEPVVTSSNPQVQQKVASTDFDWENSLGVILNNGNFVSLPWGQGGSSVIPSYILDSQKKIYGWELYYNTLNWQSGTNMNYLIFYNKFTGVLRVFLNNSEFANNTSGLFEFGLEGNVSTSILNCINPFATPISVKQSSPSGIFSNITETSLTGFRTGWNCFEVDLAYDPNVASSSTLYFHIFPFMQSISDITLQGTFQSQTTGELVTTTTSNPFSSIVNAIVGKGGTAATNWLKNKVDTGSLKVSSTLKSLIINNAPDLLGELVKAGINGVFSSFIGGLGSSSTSVQKINLRTEGKMVVNGTLTTTSPSTISDVNRLPLPSTNYNFSGGYWPSNDKIWGSWNIDNAPVVQYNPNANGSGQWLHQNYRLDANSFNVVVNPEVLKDADVVVTKELWCYDKYQGRRIDPNTFTGNVGVYGTLIYSDRDNVFYRNAYALKYINDEYYDTHYTGGVTVYEGVNKCFVVKVTVTLTPKSSTTYAKDPIVMTRTYIPTYVEANI